MEQFAKMEYSNPLEAGSLGLMANGDTHSKKTNFKATHRVMMACLMPLIQFNTRGMGRNLKVNYERTMPMPPMSH